MGSYADRTFCTLVVALNNGSRVVAVIPLAMLLDLKAAAWESVARKSAPASADSNLNWHPVTCVRQHGVHLQPLGGDRLSRLADPEIVLKILSTSDQGTVDKYLGNQGRTGDCT